MPAACRTCKAEDVCGDTCPLCGAVLAQSSPPAHPRTPKPRRSVIELCGDDRPSAPPQTQTGEKSLMRPLLLAAFIAASAIIPFVVVALMR